MKIYALKKIFANKVSDKFLFWRRSSEGHDCELTQEMDPGNWRPLPLPVLGMYILPTSPTVGLFSRMQPWESSVFLRPSDYSTWLNPVAILAGGWGHLLFLWPLKTNLVCKFLSTKPATYPAREICLFPRFLLVLQLEGPVCKPILLY